MKDDKWIDDPNQHRHGVKSRDSGHMVAGTGSSCSCDSASGHWSSCWSHRHSSPWCGLQPQSAQPLCVPLSALPPPQQVQGVPRHWSRTRSAGRARPTLSIQLWPWLLMSSAFPSWVHTGSPPGGSQDLEDEEVPVGFPGACRSSAWDTAELQVHSWVLWRSHRDHRLFQD